jgi:hypothetical protein
VFHSFASELQDVILEVILSEKCCINIGVILSGYREQGNLRCSEYDRGVCCNKKLYLMLRHDLTQRPHISFDVWRQYLDQHFDDHWIGRVG